MKRTVLFVAIAAALILASVATASGADVSAQATLGSDVVHSIVASPGTASMTVSATVGPKLRLTMPGYIDFGSVVPDDTGSKAFNVEVCATRGFSMTRAVGANNLGLDINGDVETGVVEAAGGVFNYAETANITVGWAEGLKQGDVTYTVVW